MEITGPPLPIAPPFPREAADLVAPGAGPLTVFLDAAPYKGEGCSVSGGSANQPCVILLVDDNEDLLLVMASILEMMGYVVLSCENAQLASEVFRSRGDIGLLLTDLQMPGRSGLELARELTKLCPSLPVVIVSGSVLFTELARELRARNWTFLSKPFDVSALLETVRLLLRPSQQRAA